MSKVLVTGANGFVGQALCQKLLAEGYSVTAAVRRSTTRANDVVAGCETYFVGDLGAKTDWTEALCGVDVVVHLAARVHVMKDTADDPLAAFRQVNVVGTSALARVAASHGVKCFVYLSSIKVNGEYTAGKPFSPIDEPAPQDPYGVSKWEAEQVLQQVAAESGMGLVILRPPLIYGPGVKANFFRLMEWINRGVPLPLRGIHNRRSMLFLGNLVDALCVCISNPATIGKTYLMSDGEDVSTSQLIETLAHLMGQPVRLWKMPQPLLRMMRALMGRSAELERLLSSLEIDSSAFHKDTGWTPPFTLEQGLRQTVDWYQEGYAQ